MIRVNHKGRTSSHIHFKMLQCQNQRQCLLFDHRVIKMVTIEFPREEALASLHPGHLPAARRRLLPPDWHQPGAKRSGQAFVNPNSITVKEYRPDGVIKRYLPISFKQIEFTYKITNYLQIWQAQHCQYSRPFAAKGKNLAS